ncbi:hypothetical protein XENOCAPTIV_005644 [Xenoophorus captivus]|uniref:Uncharacterized protein n=1 Tax=Xenoophorus captivus TaxID=1517983 RepID=A0ABV0SDI1_9TELE
MNGSSTAVTYAADNQVYIAGHPAFINYSTSKKISRPGDSDDSRSVNNVLLFTIMNPIYPITTVRTTFNCRVSQPEQVRGMLMEKTPRGKTSAGVALKPVNPSAQRAKASLNGADIYSGCCTLKIEYAKVRLPFVTLVFPVWL